jgi:hypothetical protein
MPSHSPACPHSALSDRVLLFRLSHPLPALKLSSKLLSMDAHSPACPHALLMACYPSCSQILLPVRTLSCLPAHYLPCLHCSLPAAPFTSTLLSSLTPLPACLIAHPLHARTLACVHAHCLACRHTLCLHVLFSSHSLYQLK